MTRGGRKEHTLDMGPLQRALAAARDKHVEDGHVVYVFLDKDGVAVTQGKVPKRAVIHFYAIKDGNLASMYRGYATPGSSGEGST